MLKVTKENLEKDFETHIEECQKEAIIIVDEGKEIAVLLGYESYKVLKENELALAYQEYAQDKREIADLELWETTVADGLDDEEF